MAVIIPQKFHIYLSPPSERGLTSQLILNFGLHLWQVLWWLESMACRALWVVRMQQGSSQQVCMHCFFILLSDFSIYDHLKLCDAIRI